MAVVKVRGSDHSKDVRCFDIVDDKTVIGERLSEYSGILSGQPVRRRRALRIRKTLHIA